MRFSYILFTALIGCGCTGTVKEKIDSTSKLSAVFSDSIIQQIDSAFATRNITGCFILYDVKKDTVIVYNATRVKVPYLPASTFKILNSLISLQCGSIKDIDEVIAWDSVERFLPEWNRDQTMRSAIKYSTVWFYQELSRRTGSECMQLWVDSAAYGNHKIGPNIDDFWLTGDIRITPEEQVTFLNKLVKEDLPFKREYIQAVKEILIEDQNSQYIFRAKTGWSDYGKEIGWYIGYIEIGGEAYIFVNNIDINNQQDGRARKDIVKEILDFAFHIDLNL